MKRLIAFLTAAIMVVSLASCGGNENATNNNDATNATEVTSEVAKEPETVGEKLLADFKADSTGTPQEIAERILSNEIIQFMSGATPVEEGLLTGFDNAEIKGFKEGVMFGPAMSSIAFVGYIFELPEDADVEAFKTTLKDSANLRWNICVEAEELIVENEGNKVFFLMCPKSLAQPEDDGAMAGDMDMPADVDVPADDMIPAEDGITLE